MKTNMILNYSSLTKFFHWFIATLVVLMLSGSFFLEDVPEQFAGTAYMIHKSLGLTVLTLMVLRLLWILHAGRPSLPNTVPKWQRLLSRTVQYSLYLFLILMPLSGWIMSMAANRVPSFFGLFNVPFPGIAPNEDFSKVMVDVHETIAWILIFLLILHVSGAIKHHFIDKDDVLRQMLPRRKKNKS